MTTTADALRWCRWLAALSLVLIVSLALEGRARAQDAVAASPKVVHVKLENAHVRVLEAISNPGDKEAMHSHPTTIVYVVAGGKLRMSTPDGKSNVVELKTGDTLYRDPVTHAAENVGTTQVHTIIVELKAP
jgi:mannose-6-phosphate isomerase-like protein (cupin superfamily)